MSYQYYGCLLQDSGSAILLTMLKFQSRQVLLVGHDWGSIVGWFLCLLRPDRVKGYIAVSVPVLQRGPSEVDWVQQWTSILGEGFYIARFQVSQFKLICKFAILSDSRFGRDPIIEAYNRDGRSVEV